MSLDSIFKEGLPSTLFMTHYELSDKFGSTPNEWRQYLKDNEHFITSETAAIAEANARAALSRLGTGATSQEVTAIKALLEKSKLINDAQKQQQHVMLTYMPTKGQETQEQLMKYMQQEHQQLQEYLEHVIYLADLGRFDKTTHTKQWFRKYKEGK